MYVLQRIKQNSFMKISIGLVYLWFGGLKFFPELSPAEGLATETIGQLTLGLLPADVSIILLALLEVGIGLFLLLNLFPRKVAMVALGHLICTFAPFFFFNGTSFNEYPVFLTLVGQYIIKNIIIIAALLSIIREKSAIGARREIVEH